MHQALMEHHKSTLVSHSSVNEGCSSQEVSPSCSSNEKAMEMLLKAGMKTPGSQEQQQERLAEQKRSISLWSD